MNKIYLIIAAVIVCFLMMSCYDNPTEPKPESKKYIPVDTASRYEWTGVVGWFPSVQFDVVDTSNIYIATDFVPIKYDGVKFTTINLDDNKFYCSSVDAINNDCIFFGGKKVVSTDVEIPTVKRYMNGSIKTFEFLSNTNGFEVIYSIYGLSEDEFWAAKMGRLYYVKNDIITVFDDFGKKAGPGTFFRYPDGRLIYSSGIEDDSVGISLFFVCSLDNGKITKLSIDTFSIGYDYGLEHSLTEDFIRRIKRNVCYYNGSGWEKFFSIDDLDPAYVYGFFSAGGKSKSEYMFSPFWGDPLLFKDNKWSYEASYESVFDGYNLPQVHFYEDRIYYIKSRIGTKLVRGKLKNK